VIHKAGNQDSAFFVQPLAGYSFNWTSEAWEASVLPLNYARSMFLIVFHSLAVCTEVE
jgi:hypothetical protein